MIDAILFCPYCGDIMDAPNEKQIDIFGYPDCCDQDMLKMDKNNLHKLVKGISKLKDNLENELVKDQL